MTNRIFSLGAGAFVLYALFFGSQSVAKREAEQEAKYEASAIKKWNVSETQVPILRDCNASLSRHEKRFSERVPHMSACACVAQRIGKQVRPENYQYASNVLDIVIEVSTKKDSKKLLFTSLKKDKSLDGLSFKKRADLLSVATKAVRHCNSLEQHIDNPKLLKIYQEARAKRRLRQQK